MGRLALFINSRGIVESAPERRAAKHRGSEDWMRLHVGMNSIDLLHNTERALNIDNLQTGYRAAATRAQLSYHFETALVVLYVTWP